MFQIGLLSVVKTAATSSSDLTVDFMVLLLLPQTLPYRPNLHHLFVSVSSRLSPFVG